ncbi:MAG: D-arabinitol 4-dehydrogenase [Ramlibacter sp.]
MQLHIGLGSFHRAHQAACLHRLRESGDRSWSIAAGNARDDMAGTVAELAAQGGAYTLETVTPAGERAYERITSITRVIPFTPDQAGLVAAGADPDTRIISFTVTEAGYALDAHDRLELRTPELVADVQAARQGRAGTSIHAVLTAILRARMQAGAGPVTLLCCDNLRHNGDRSRSGLMQFIDATGDRALAAWVEASTSSPNAMVDRITPRPTPDIAERMRAATGWADAAPVMAESFLQWVIEDRFIAGRPAWENAGAAMVDSVAPYEEAKIRILNASHSCIAWAGTLAGLESIHEGTHDATIRSFVHAYVTDDVIPCLHRPGAPSPLDLAAYRDVVLDRFGNPAIRDANQRVAADSFAKIAGFIRPTLVDRLARKERIDSTAMLPALFLAFLRRWHQGTLPYTYQDQAMDPKLAHAICEAADPAAALCADATLFGPITGDPRLVAAVRAAGERVLAFEARRQPAS